LGHKQHGTVRDPSAPQGYLPADSCMLVSAGSMVYLAQSLPARKPAHLRAHRCGSLWAHWSFAELQLDDCARRRQGLSSFCVFEEWRAREGEASLSKVVSQSQPVSAKLLNLSGPLASSLGVWGHPGAPAGSWAASRSLQELHGPGNLAPALDELVGACSPRRCPLRALASVRVALNKLARTPALLRLPGRRGYICKKKYQQPCQL